MTNGARAVFVRANAVLIADKQISGTVRVFSLQSLAFVVRYEVNACRALRTPHGVECSEAVILELKGRVGRDPFDHTSGTIIYYLEDIFTVAFAPAMLPAA